MASCNTDGTLIFKNLLRYQNRYNLINEQHLQSKKITFTKY